MPATTIQLSESVENFDEIRAICDTYINGPTGISNSCIPTSSNAIMGITVVSQNSLSKNLTFFDKVISISGTTVTISNTSFHEQGQTPTTNNDNIIPYKIIGIKYVN